MFYQLILTPRITPETPTGFLLCVREDSGVKTLLDGLSGKVESLASLESLG